MRELLRVQRLLWLGHCWRMGEERLPKMLLWGRLEGKRSRSRPPLRWREDVVRSDVKDMGLTQAWSWLAGDSAAWKAAAKAAAPRRRLAQ